ncbi:Pirin-related protein [Herbaspirillum sp. CF444]|uniref:pirin family protein n=1 Tax=Herbaspirillum sp. CF444 TaxID=1144319 RepID=UPI0002724B54|nr:pirin family protein [Herbaspirillum sp. CF444]EJL94351.1 Pirin-related protein [Herbaspirillum sp. CF444]
MLQIRNLDSLAGSDLVWLKSKHHFALMGYDNATHAPLGSLIVLNDDQVEPGTGFPMHGHRDMEIVTYVREGLLAHEDTTGGRAHIVAGNVQAFSAGSGIRHAEYNPGSTPLKIFQIWLRPRRLGIKPQWSAKPFPKTERANRWVALASGLPGDEDAIAIDADARVLGATVTRGRSLEYEIGDARYGYLVVASGAVSVNGLRLDARDGIAAKDVSKIVVAAIDDAEVVLVDVA